MNKEKIPLIEVYQNDWMPGFAAFLDDGSLQSGARPKIALNIAAFLSAVATKDIAPEELPYIIADSIMHEVIHVLESWAGVEFSEDRVESLIAKYRQYEEKNNEHDRDKDLPA